MRWMLSRTASLGQADQDRLGQAGRDIDFRLDGHGVDADQGEGVQLGEHGRLRKTTDAAEMEWL